ncbi:MAG: SlyX family protein [Spirochaetales bacterium]|nr:SlyX family protein [Spirochaetales bacterium]
MEESIIKIETKLAHLEEMVLTLNKLVVQQGREIELLKGYREIVEAKVAELAEATFEVDSERPPHY